MADYYSKDNQRGEKGGLTPERIVMVQGLLQLTLKNPAANLKDPTSTDPADLAMLQNIHPDDFYKGEKLSDDLRDLFRDHGHKTQFDYVAPNGDLYRLTSNVRANDNPLSGLLNSVVADKNFNLLSQVSNQKLP